MTIKECYEVIGSDYQEILTRLGSEMLIKRFAIKFLDDTTFSQLTKSMQVGCGEEAFRGAHTLKGVCLNLGFWALADASSELTEVLRSQKETHGCEELFQRVADEYDKLVSALKLVE